MKNYTFYWELKNLLTQFMSALDDCVIKRYDKGRVARDELQVRIMYSPKSRTIHNLVNKQQSMELPVISVSIGGIQRAPNRQFNKIDGATYLQEQLSSPLQPIPVDISVNVSILTKFQQDADQIVSNIVPYFDPYIIVSWTHPEMSQELRSKVEWSGNLSYSYPNELQASQPYRQSIDTTFTIQGWLFKKAESNTGIIHTIKTDFIGVADMTEIEKDYYDPEEYDRFILSGIPVVYDVKPLNINKDDASIVYLAGNMLDKADSVYLSGSMYTYTSADYIDAFSSDGKLSADNPPFYGREVSYDTVGNVMMLELDAIQSVGNVDIIMLNQAGYGSIIKNANVGDTWVNGINIF